MSENYYQLLGLSLDYEIDKQQLTNNFRELQRSVHPDNYANHSDRDKRLSVQKSAHINDAYQTLKNPLTRAIYQLSLYGVILADNATAMDNAFLMEQMLLREQLEQVNKQNDPLASIEKMQIEVRGKLTQSIKQIATLFKQVNHIEQEKNGGIVEEQDALKQIQQTVLKMQFLSKLQQECDDIEEDILNNT